MPIQELIALANEFATLQLKKEDIPITARSPRDESSPPTTRAIPNIPGLGMDFSQVAHRIRDLVKSQFHIEANPIRKHSHSGYSFTIPLANPDNELFEHIKHIIKKLYPTDVARESHWSLELSYPEDDAIITLRLWEKDISFKITTPE